MVIDINKIVKIEEYVKTEMSSVVAHDFKHVQRVRKWALLIAQKEGYQDLEMVEIAALMHDIGLVKAEKRSLHGQVGADMSASFLRENFEMESSRLDDVVNAIRYHNTNREGEGTLLFLLRDADMMDMFGAVGLMRSFTSKAHLPDYDDSQIKGETWGLQASDFNQRFDSGIGIGNYITDQINFQISCFDNLYTPTAKKLAEPLIQFKRDFINQLVKEIGNELLV